MNAILAIPLPVRLLALFVAGAYVGGLVNWAACALAWNPQPAGPWSAVPPGGRGRGVADRLPLVRWLGLRRSAAPHDRRLWVRGLMVELLTGLLFVGLYWWDTQYAHLTFAAFGAAPPRGDFLSDNLPLVAHLHFAGHALLCVLMLAASLVDLDEKTIPDSITVAGTLAALALALVYPWSLPSAGAWIVAARPHVEFLTLVSPGPWPEQLSGLPQAAGLAAALGCWTLWCGGLLPRYWNTRHGWTTAVRVFCHRLRVERVTYAILLMWLFGTAVISLTAWRAAEAHWAGLLTALVGMAGGGAIIWAVRTIGAAALKREAMGFGDVTLVSMIGAFLGWQACLMIFFVAPFFGLAFAVANWVLHGEREIPYGPFLCLAALAVVLRWPAFWDRTADIFALGWVVPALLAVCLVLLGVLLVAYRGIGRLIMRSG